MKRREFVVQTCTGLAALHPVLSARLFGHRVSAPWLLVPMDDAQSDHLKAYGLAYRALKRGAKAEWFLNFRNGSFLLPGDAATARDAALAGVTVEPIDDAKLAETRGLLQGGNRDAVPLETPRKVGVYAPPNAPPCDDEVAMALNYSWTEFEKTWDGEFLQQKLKNSHWLQLHHQ